MVYWYCKARGMAAKPPPPASEYRQTAVKFGGKTKGEQMKQKRQAIWTYLKQLVKNYRDAIQHIKYLSEHTDTKMMERLSRFWSMRIEQECQALKDLRSLS